MFASPVNRAFGLAFDVEKSDKTRSGFAPAEKDLGGDKHLFGNFRLDAFALMLRLDFCRELVVVGGNEGRYKGEEPVVNRAEAIRKMLIEDLNADPLRVRAIPSSSNTGGNLTIVESLIEIPESPRPVQSAIVSNHYHVPRISVDLALKGIAIPVYSAEAFLLLGIPTFRFDLFKAFGCNPFADRVVQEIQGIADKLRGTYVPRTDIKPK